MKVLKSCYKKVGTKLSTVQAKKVAKNFLKANPRSAGYVTHNENEPFSNGIFSLGAIVHLKDGREVAPPVAGAGTSAGDGRRITKPLPTT